MFASGLHPRQRVPRDGSGTSHRRGLQGIRRRRLGSVARLRCQPGSQERRRRQALEGPGRSLEGAQSHHVHRHGHAQTRTSGRGGRRRGRRACADRSQRCPRLWFGAPPAAGFRRRRPVGDDVGRVPRPAQAPRLGRRHRRRRGRLRVRLPAGRPRFEGHDPRGARLDLAGVRRRHRASCRPGLQKARHRHRDRGQGRIAHALGRRDRHDGVGGRPVLGRRSHRGIRRAVVPGPKAWSRTGSASRSTSEASS